MHSWLTRCSIASAVSAVAFALVLSPTSAQAAGTDVVVTGPDVPKAPATTTAPAAPAPKVEVEQTKAAPDPTDAGSAAVKHQSVPSFRMVGVTWDAEASARGVTVQVQVRTGGEWGSWQTLESEDTDGEGRPGTEPLWTDTPADGIAVKATAATGHLSGVRATTIDPGKSEVVTPIENAVFDPTTGSITSATSTGDGTPSVVPMPSIITRAKWGAGPGTYCSAPQTRPKALGVVIHHTAGSNTYSKADSAALVRSYQSYHVKGHGWCDIGYNFLVDRFGQVFEGRKGGMLNQVRAAHSGVDAVNQWASGISMMGNFDYVTPSAALQSAVVKLVGWRLKYFGADPKGTYVAGGKRYPVITGHRDVKSTACPGKYAYAWLGAKGGLRDRVAAYVSKAKSAATTPGTPPPTTPAKLASPANVRIAPSTTTATVTWSAVAGATAYRVAVKPVGSSVANRMFTVSTPKATITGLSARTAYQFRVAAFSSGAASKSNYTAKPFPAATTRPFLPVSGIRATARGKKALRFTWTAQTGAPGYRVQLVGVSGAKGKRYAETRTNTVTMKKLAVGAKYRVRITVIDPSTRTRLGPYTVAPFAFLSTKAASTSSSTPAPAPAASAANSIAVSGGSVTFKGRGYGHGIGMSQYGAEGGARAGHKYDAILRKYYPGTTLSTKSASIRVLLSADTTNSVYVLPKAGLKLRTLGTNQVRTLPTKVGSRAVKAWSIDTAKSNRAKNTLYYKSGSSWYEYVTFPADGQFEGPTTISLVMPNGSSQAFRGALRSTKPSSGSTSRDTVNVLSLEDYVRGVVAREMPSSWSLEALKAQSVAARTFGSRYLGSSRHYDICDTTSCQVYGGVAAETSRTNQAIDGTRGKILTSGGAPALTQFSSSSGGYTNRGSFAYLSPVNDPWDGWSGNKNHSWSQKVSARTIEAKYPIGTLRSLSITKRNGYGALGGRVVSLTIKGTKGSRTITGVDARWAFGLRSDWFGF